MSPFSAPAALSTAMNVLDQIAFKTMPTGLSNPAIATTLVDHAAMASKMVTKNAMMVILTTMTSAPITVKIQSAVTVSVTALKIVIGAMIVKIKLAMAVARRVKILATPPLITVRRAAAIVAGPVQKTVKGLILIVRPANR